MTRVSPSVTWKNYWCHTSFIQVLSLSLTNRDWHVDKADFTRSVLHKMHGRLSSLEPIQLLVVSQVVVMRRDPPSVLRETHSALR